MAVERLKWQKYHRLLFNKELDELKEYVKTSRAALKKVEREYEAWLVTQAPEDEDDRNDFYQTFGRKGMNLAMTFPAIGNSAAFVTIISFFEHTLFKICELFGGYRKYQLTVYDIAGHGVDKCITYLSKMGEITPPVNSPEWQEIQWLRKVRNVIVHRMGKLKGKEDGKLRNYLQAKDSVQLSGSDGIILSDAFCVEAIDTIRAFLNNLMERLPPR